MKTYLAAIAAATALSVAVPAAADTVRIETSDLNLASPAGQQKLDRRITNAARAFCEIGADRTTGTRIRSQASNTCFDAFVKRARQQMTMNMPKNPQVGAG